MQAVAHMITRITTQTTTQPRPSFINPADPNADQLTTVITPSENPTQTPRWSQNPLCGPGDELDEDEAYFLGEEDDDEEDDYDDEDDDDLDEDDDEVDDSVDLDDDEDF